ncbi:MAG: Glycosyl transferase, family 2 [uncultured Acidimicrobiales bacterium]|uniref:Glycosyl transferase, family 2 n=1 Tax=uncultured Acidimicrobiales bacterium TaxID=310071 RepID=A0A6J4HT41_9ACTN|nr:MAG: Glycosyl transferase, family 2 [uncultured Acidimicrobiales bacterium]
MIRGALGEGGADLSIMIPTYNCAEFLEETLTSLCGQGVDRAQVEVVDDCSTRDDPEAVVQRVGAGWVAFHRQAENLGLVGNFNACLSRAERTWVHILHGDDSVLPGGYGELAGLLDRHPSSNVLFGRCVMVDARGVWDDVSPVLGPDLEGPLPYDPFRWTLNPVQFAGTLFRREAAVAVGGFDDRFVHAADWDLWWKLAKRFPTAYTNRCVGAYRRFPASHTSGLVRSAGNVRESLRLVEQIAAAEPEAGPGLYGPLFGLTVHQAKCNADDTAAVLAHIRLMASFPPAVPRTRKITRTVLTWAKTRVANRRGRPVGERGIASS